MKNTILISSVITGILVFSLMVYAEEIQETPDVDYPSYQTVPKTSFACSEQKYIPGFYADMETDCQVFHFCEENRQESFLCPTGTTFNQASLTCDSWDSSNCSLAPLFYSVNSGPELEDARRDIFMALHLKSKSRSRPSLRPSDVYEKITSLYDNFESSHQSTKSDVNVDLNNKISHEQETYKETEDRKETLSQLIEGLDESSQNDGMANEYSMVPSDVSESYDMKPEIFYDPVTEKYYIDTEDIVDKYNDFKYGDFEKRYGVGYDGYVDVIQSDPESEVSKGVEGLEEVNEISYIDGTSEREDAQQDTQQPLRRIRRKPTYIVVQDDYEVVYADDGRSLPIENSADRYKTESTHTDDSSELLEETSSEGNDAQEQSDSEAAFETYESENQGELGNIPETSQDSEEYEQELLTRLNLLGFREHDLEQPSPLEDQQRDGESVDDVSEDYQSDDEYSYVENMIPPDYESYSVQYNEDSRFVPEQESDQDSEEISNWYQGDESFSVEDSEESDDSYVVIPDEYDTPVSEENSEAHEQAESYNAESYDTDSYWRNYFSRSHVYPQAYSPVGPYWFPAPQYFPSGYRLSPQVFSGDYFRSRFLRSPQLSDSGTPNDQEFQYVSDDGISPEGYYPLHYSSSYSDEIPSSVEGAYDFSVQHGYPYANVYGNFYTGNYGYGVSEEMEATESPVSNGDAVDTTHLADGGYSELEMQPWMQDHSTEGSEIEDGILVTERSIPTEEAIADLYAEMSNDGMDINEVPSEVSFPDQPEEFYLFDFDEDGEEKIEQDTAGISETDAEQLDINQMFQTEESLLHNESLKDSKGGQVDSMLKSIESTQSEEFSQENKPVDGAENANALNAVKAPRSNFGNAHLFDGSTSFNNKIYPESNVQPKGDVEGFSMASNLDNDFISRAGDTGNSMTSSKLSEIQERIRSLKKGKFGAFKKYITSTEIKN